MKNIEYRNDATAYDWSSRTPGTIFGVTPEAADLDQRRADLKQVVTDFVDGRADQRAAATILAAGIRPLLPVRPATTVYLTGGPGSGKSAAAIQATSFCVLPDQMIDLRSRTGAATEDAVASYPIWVTDDFADLDQRELNAREASVAFLIRSVHNGRPGHRTNRSASGPQAHTPQALLIVVAEHLSTSFAVRQRSINVDFGGQPDRIDAPTIAQKNARSRVAGGIVAMLSCPDAVDHVEAQRTAMKSAALVVFREHGVNAEMYARASMVAADLMLGLSILSDYAATLGLDEIADHLAGPNNPNALISKVAEQVAANTKVG
jgi:hypothetical protein